MTERSAEETGALDALAQGLEFLIERAVHHAMEPYVKAASEHETEFDRALSMAQAARALGTSSSTLKKWMDAELVSPWFRDDNGRPLFSLRTIRAQQRRAGELAAERSSGRQIDDIGPCPSPGPIDEPSRPGALVWAPGVGGKLVGDG